MAVGTYDAVATYPVRRWLLARAATSGLTADEGPAVASDDTFYDTPDRRLYRAGILCGVRARGREPRLAYVARLDAPGPDRALATATLAADDDALVALPGTPGILIRNVVGPRPLVAQLGIRAVGSPVVLARGGGRQLTVHLEELTYRAAPDRPRAGAGAPPTISAVRVAIDTADEGDPLNDPMVAELVEACGLHATQTSPFLAGLQALGVAPPAPPDVGPTALAEAATTSELAYAALRRQLLVLLGHEPGTRLDLDPEELHDMRVGTRRLRSLLRLFAEHLPPWAGRQRLALEPIAGALGAVRDLDVQIQYLRDAQAEFAPADRDASEAIVALLLKRRGRARRQLLRVLDSRRYERLLAALARDLRRGPPQRLRRSPPIRMVAPDLIEGRFRRLKKAGDAIGPKSAPGRYHRLRIRAKALRYALEALAELYGRPARRVVRALAALQDLLGEHQDADVRSLRLQALVDADGRRLPARALFVAGRLTERSERRARRLRARFPAAFALLTGDRWQSLRAAFLAAWSEAQPRPPAAAPRAASRSPGAGRVRRAVKTS